MKKITNDEKLQIIDFYKNGVKCQEIADMFGITKVRVSQIGKENNQKRRDKVIDCPKEIVEEMYTMYLNGDNVEKISDKYDIHRASIYNLFRKYGFELEKDRHRPYEVNDEYFDCIDTPNKAYVLGLLWADGHNNTKKGHIEIRLQERDKHILEDVSLDMQNNRPLYLVPENRPNRPNRQDTYRMYVTSRRISDNLLYYGMSSNKTYILEWPKNLPEALIPHFLRGFTDGDGHIGDSEVEWVGTKMMMEKIQEILYNTLDIECKICNTKNDIIKTIHIRRKNYVRQILDWIYKDADLKLNRKFLKYQEIVNKDKQN